MGLPVEMVFNPDITKQAVEVFFSVKNKKPSHPELIFIELPVARENRTKHLDSHLNFQAYQGGHLKSFKSLLIEGYLIYVINFMFGRILIMAMLFTIIKELI